MVSRNVRQISRYLPYNEWSTILNTCPSPSLSSSSDVRHAWCHGHARPGRVAHGRMPMTSQTLVMSFHSSVFPFVILGRMMPQKYHV